MMQYVEIEFSGIIVVLPVEDGQFFFCNDDMRFKSIEVSKKFKELSSNFWVVTSGMGIPAFSCGDGGNRVVQFVRQDAFHKSCHRLAQRFSVVCLDHAENQVWLKAWTANQQFFSIAIKVRVPTFIDQDIFFVVIDHVIKLRVINVHYAF